MSLEYIFCRKSQENRCERKIQLQEAANNDGCCDVVTVGSLSKPFLPLRLVPFTHLTGLMGEPGVQDSPMSPLGASVNDLYFSGDYDKQRNEINGRSWWRKGDFGIWFDGDKNCKSDWIIGSISK